MVPLGLGPVFLAVVELSLIQMKAGEALRAVLIPHNMHRRVSDKQAYLHPPRRGRRELLSCSIGQYPHPDGSHCCMKCHKGTHVAQHCSGKEKATNCTVCLPGAFMPIDNYREQCFGCGNCRSSFGQITISNCTSKHDTVCGCGENQYQTNESPEFFCKKCSSCQNGTIRQDCTKHKDTICECLPGYFRRADENNCSPCTSCNNPDCKQHCDAMISSVINPPKPEYLMYILGTLVVVLGVACVFFLARKIAKQTRQKKQKASSNPSSLGPESMGEPTSKVTVCPLLVPPLIAEQLSQIAPNVPVPCVRSARERQIPNRPEVLYTVVDQVPPARWKEFIRYLGLNENVVERITIEQRYFKEAQYEMLRYWRIQAGQNATVDRISNALNQMELNGCSEAIQEALAKQH